MTGFMDGKSILTDCVEKQAGRVGKEKEKLQSVQELKDYTLRFSNTTQPHDGNVSVIPNYQGSEDEDCGIIIKLRCNSLPNMDLTALTESPVVKNVELTSASEYDICFVVKTNIYAPQPTLNYEGNRDS